MLPLKNNQSTFDPRLDRVPEYDEQSREYKVRTLLQMTAAPPVKRTKARFPSVPTLDQGREGACVGFSIATLANASPIRRFEELNNDDAKKLYYAAQQLDPWPGGEYPGAVPQYGGTSVLAGMKAAQAAGLIDSYYWCGAGSGTPGDDMVDALIRVGGVILGIPWYYSMFVTTPHGQIEVDPTSGLPGYHAICAHSFRYAPLPGGSKSKKVEHAVVQNSWGETNFGVSWYGVGGHGFLTIEDCVNKLLPQEVQGECAVPIEKAA